MPMSMMYFLSCSPTHIEMYTLFDMNMVGVQAEDFFMGGAPPIAQPTHRVSWSHAYWIADIEITQQMYEFITKTNPSETQSPTLPVSNILWTEALKFCNALSRLEQKTPCYTNISTHNADWELECDGYRLPTEAEWEYVALGDQESFSDLELDEYAWSKRNSQKTTHPVGSKKANVYGVYDMLGNVWEWVWDIHGAYPSTEIIDPTGAKKGPFRIRRGGGYSSGASRVNPTKRYALNPINEHSFLGFRLVRTVKK